MNDKTYTRSCASALPVTKQTYTDLRPQHTINVFCPGSYCWNSVPYEYSSVGCKTRQPRWVCTVVLETSMHHRPTETLWMCFVSAVTVGTLWLREMQDGTVTVGINSFLRSKQANTTSRPQHSHHLGVCPGSYCLNSAQNKHTPPHD